MGNLFKNLTLKNSLWLLIATLLLPSILTIVTISPAHAATNAKVFVDPPNNLFTISQKHVNDEIQVNVTIANLTGLAGYEFKLFWNSSVLEGVSFTENLFSTVTPSGQSSNIWELANEVGSDHIWAAYTYKNLTKAYSLGYAPVNVTTAKYSEGKLAALIVTLKIIAEPPDPGTFLESSLDLTTSKTGALPPPMGPGGDITHTTESGHYKLSAPSLPTPEFSVQPAIYTATSRNETFKINVTMNNLDEGLKVVGIEFKLNYDPNILTVTNVSEGPFMKSFGGAPNQGTQFMPVSTSSYELVGILVLPDAHGTWHSPFPNGNGTIATVTFKVVAGPIASCNLTLSGTKIGDYHAKAINHTKTNGAFQFNVETLQHSFVVGGVTYTVVTQSNATISPTPIAILPEQRMIDFNATGPDGATCYVNISIPKNFLWLAQSSDTWLVKVGGFSVTPTTGQNGTHWWLYFTFTTSLKPVQIVGTAIIPEFPATASLLLLLLASTAIVLSYRWKSKKVSAKRST